MLSDIMQEPDQLVMLGARSLSLPAHKRHFLMRRRHKVATEMALNVLAYNIKRVITILGCRPLLEAMQT